MSLSILLQFSHSSPSVYVLHVGVLAV